MAEEGDFLVTYRPKIDTLTGMAGVDHALHYSITPKGTFNRYYEKYGNEKNLNALNSIFIKFSWDIIQVQMNSNSEI